MFVFLRITQNGKCAQSWPVRLSRKVSMEQCNSRCACCLAAIFDRIDLHSDICFANFPSFDGVSSFYEMFFCRDVSTSRATWWHEGVDTGVKLISCQSNTCEHSPGHQRTVNHFTSPNLKLETQWGGFRHKIVDFDGHAVFVRIWTHLPSV